METHNYSLIHYDIRLKHMLDTHVNVHFVFGPEARTYKQWIS